MDVQKKKFHYKWVILVICFLMEFICLGFCSSNAGMYLTAITKALSIPRSLYAVRTSIRYIVSTGVSLFFGTMLNKLGYKKMVCIGLAALLSSTLLSAVAEKLPTIYLSGALLGLGVTLTGGTMAATIVRHWFKENIGKFTGIVMSANGIGGALAAQIISPLIYEEGNLFGYKKAYLLSSLITLIISIIILVFLRKPAGDTAENMPAKKKKRGASWAGIPYEKVKRLPTFYMLAAMVFLTGIGLQSISNISTAILYDTGFDPSFVATASTVSSLVLAASKIAVGATYDKKGLRLTLLFCHSAALLSFVLKAFLANTLTGRILAIISVICGSFAMPLETVMLPLLANDFFGDAGYTKVLGVFMAMNSLGLCLGAPVGNLCYDLTGNHIPILWIFSVVMVLVIVGFQIIFAMARREKEKILSLQAAE